MELTGQRLGSYRIHDELSRGGRGVVYRATDIRLNRDVALKVLPAYLLPRPHRRAAGARRQGTRRWKDGDLDRDRVAEAQRRISS